MSAAMQPRVVQPVRPGQDRQLECLLQRLDELERRPAPEHERPILEVARASLLDAIRELAHRLHATDYWRLAPARVVA
jgi:hypothetical protein